MVSSNYFCVRGARASRSQKANVFVFVACATRARRVHDSANNKNNRPAASARQASIHEQRRCITGKHPEHRIMAGRSWSTRDTNKNTNRKR